MDDTLLKLNVENVFVRYIIGDLRNIGMKDFVVQKCTRKYQVQEFMAVNGVNFQLEQGDFLGIVGRNGAGKTTLLKAISGVLEPSKGRIWVNGTIAALLSLGTGFDGDLTVRENIFLRGAMLGYTHAFMKDRYQEILAFAELEAYERRAFKHLSSGMKSRLAFSVSALVRPDILILDEVFATGDGAFRKKSEEKMMEVIAGGATTLCVSHSTAQMRKLCNKVLWLNEGKQMAFGKAGDVLDKYEKFLKEQTKANVPKERQGIQVANSAKMAATSTGTSPKNLAATSASSSPKKPLASTSEEKLPTQTKEAVSADNANYVNIEESVQGMSRKGMSPAYINFILKDICGFDISEERIFEIAGFVADKHESR